VIGRWSTGLHDTRWRIAWRFRTNLEMSGRLFEACGWAGNPDERFAITFPLPA
jgi:hypothetical protein